MPTREQTRELAQVQKEFVRGQRAAARRRELLSELYDEGMSQNDLADLLSKASVAVGGAAVSSNSVQKVIEKNRRRAERNGEY